MKLTSFFGLWVRNVFSPPQEHATTTMLREPLLEPFVRSCCLLVYEKLKPQCPRFGILIKKVSELDKNFVGGGQDRSHSLFRCNMEPVDYYRSIIMYQITSTSNFWLISSGDLTSLNTNSDVIVDRCIAIQSLSICDITLYLEHVILHQYKMC